MSYKAPGLTRRSFLGGSALVALLGMPVPFLSRLQKGVVPLALADEPAGGVEGKEDLTVLSDRPYNMETPAHLLDDAVTPAHRMFVRNNGLTPDLTDVSEETWFIEIDGEVDQPLRLSIADLKAKFETISLNLQLECGGNGRKFFQPGASGNQWSFGAIGCPEWTGVRLADVLQHAGIMSSAVYTAHYGADMHLSGDPDKVVLSRGVPIEKAMEPHNLIAWAMNGQPMPDLNGHPVRLVVPGWPGSCSQKWLTKITVRDQVHDGPKMTGQSYRVPAYGVSPGTKVPDEDMKIIQSLPVKSLITAPKTGVRTGVNTPVGVRGHAWAGDQTVDLVEVSIDFGATWIPASLSKPVNRYAWQRWSAELQFPQAGYYEVWARATDDRGIAQPPVPPGWNPRGYLNNMQHRIAVFAV